jgi:hypothetical protein
MSSIPDVLESARYVLARADFVWVSEAVAQRWANAQDPALFQAPSTPPELQFDGDFAACANLCLLRNCLNFCFWSERPWSVEFRGRTWTRTYAMFAAVLRAIEQDRSWLTARRWADADDATVAGLFVGQGEIPLLAQRRAVLNETGRCLDEQFGGQCLRAVEEAGRNARTFAYLLAECFASFRDVAAYRGREIALLKRAQICATDLHCLWQQHGDPGLVGMDELTVFADYRLPQYLRHVGIIELQPELAARIDRREELAAGTAEEIELRAATIWAGEIIGRGLGGAVPAWKIDFLLWQCSHDPDVGVEHHRTRTVFY